MDTLWGKVLLMFSRYDSRVPSWGEGLTYEPTYPFMPVHMFFVYRLVFKCRRVRSSS